MTFTVSADPRAINELASIWLRASDPAAVQRASDTIDAELRIDPMNYGIESGSDRIYYVPPLGVVYNVKVQDRLVTIKNYYDLG